MGSLVGKTYLTVTKVDPRNNLSAKELFWIHRAALLRLDTVYSISYLASLNSLGLPYSVAGLRVRIPPNGERTLVLRNGSWIQVPSEELGLAYDFYAWIIKNPKVLR